MSRRLAIPEPLLEGARRGNPAALEDAIALCWPHAYRIAFSILRDHAAAEDAAQETCATVYRNVGRLRNPEALTVWFYRVAMRHATGLERRHRLRTAMEWGAGTAAAPADSVVRVDVANAIARLPAAQRAAVVLRYYADLNSREIARVLEMPDSSVRFHLVQAKRTLTQLLAAHAHPTHLRACHVL